MSTRIDIYLKGGQVVVLDCDSFKAIRAGNNELIEIKYGLTKKGLRPLYTNLSDISMIVEHR